MTQRMTDSMLNATLATANHLLGFNAEYLTANPRAVGSLGLYKAYDATGVVLYLNSSGGVRTIHQLGTKREAYTFLRGFIEARRLTIESSQF